MDDSSYRYMIIGGGVAGASAIQGIREKDRNGTILLLNEESAWPYDRPPLSKKLWSGDKTIPDIFLHDPEFYEENGVELKCGVKAASLVPDEKTVKDDSGKLYRYEKLLLATGGRPRRLTIPGHDTEGICYFRYLADYESIRAQAKEGGSAVIIGGGFIGSEMTAALRMNKLDVTMIFPEPYLCQPVFPRSLGEAIRDRYSEKGVRILSEDVPVAISRKSGKFLTRTRKGIEITSDIVIAGIGIQPDVNLAASAGLILENGIVVNQYLQTSDPEIYAAGDNAYFPCAALGKKIRVEHWDNALNQGRHAGRNMAGAGEPFEYLSYFFSDLFDFGYEAIGEVDSRLKTCAHWQEANRKGILYYLSGDTIRGVMLCNIWGKIEEARQWILSGAKIQDHVAAGPPGQDEARS